MVILISLKFGMVKLLQTLYSILDVKWSILYIWILLLTNILILIYIFNKIVVFQKVSCSFNHEKVLQLIRVNDAANVQ